MKKSESQTEKKPFGTGKVVGLSFIAVLLTVILTVLLLGCMAARYFVYHKQASAVSMVPLDQVTFSDGTTPASRIKSRYVSDPKITESTVQHILRDGKFSAQIGDLFGNYCEFLADYPQGEFPEVTVGDVQELLRNNDETIQLHTGIHDFSENSGELISAVKPDLDAWNAKMRDTLDTGAKANLLRTIISQWVWILLGGLLLMVLIWLIVIHVRGQKRVAAAFKTFAIAALIPSMVLFLCGMFGTKLLNGSAYALYADAFEAISSTPKLIGGLANLACVAIFGIGVLCNAAASKKAVSTDAIMPVEPMRVPEPAAEPVTEPAAPVTEPAAPVTEPITEPDIPVIETEIVTEPEPADEEPVIIRRFCRFCGGELVNEDAKFCYKCGKPQEPAE